MKSRNLILALCLGRPQTRGTGPYHLSLQEMDVLDSTLAKTDMDRVRPLSFQGEGSGERSEGRGPRGLSLFY
jgi:hypothetical protein